MPVQHITELFALDGREFVTEAYRNLLKRGPDAHGMAYYLGRLAQGYGKAAVIAQLAQSTECRPLDEIKGLKKLIADERFATHWLWGGLSRQARLEKALQTEISVLGAINLSQVTLTKCLVEQSQTISQTNQRLNQIDEAALSIREAMFQLHKNLNFSVNPVDVNLKDSIDLPCKSLLNNIANFINLPKKSQELIISTVMCGGKQ